jgi:streptogramin lyase
VEPLESRRLLSSITEYPLPLVNGKNASPADISVGPNDTLWFIEPGANAIGSLSTTNPNPALFPGGLPSGSLPMGITLGPDANTIWFTELAANQIGMINPSDTSHTIQYFGTSDGMTAMSGPAGITAADGYLWFTQNQTHEIGRLDPSTGKITEYSAPAAMTTLNSRIVLGPDGNLWFTEFGAIGIFNPNTGAIVKQVALPSASEEPFGIAVGSDGNIWYTEGVVNSTATGYVSYGVGVINTNTESLVKEIPVAASSEPFGITAGPDGDLWFTVTGTNTVAGTIDVINPSTETITRVLAIPTNIVSVPDPVGITTGPDGNLWFTDSSGALGVVNNSQLVVTDQPQADVSINSPFGLTVTDEYASGVVDTAFSGQVTIKIASNPAGGTLAGTMTVKAVNGVATFSGLTLDKAGSGYTLDAQTSATVPSTSITTSSFNVLVDPATKLVVTTQPPSSIATGTPFSLTVTDEYVSGSVDTAFHGTITVSLPSPNVGGSTIVLGGNLTVTASNGIATFTGLTINITGNSYTLNVSGGGDGPTPTSAFDVVPPPPPSPPPPAVLPPPTVTGETAIFTQKRNKKGKPIGKPTLGGYTIDFSTAMNQATIGAPGNYVVEMLNLKKQGKRKKVEVAQPIRFSVTKVTSQSVTLQVAAKQNFPRGGQITVIASPASGVENTAGVFMAVNAVLTISPRGTGITLVN